MTDDEDRQHAATESAQEITSFWTPERRRQAAPREHAPVAEGQAEDDGDEPSPRAGAPAAEPVFVPLDQLDRTPYRQTGKLYFRVEGEVGLFAGSACVIGRSTLLTAAHNLYERIGRSDECAWSHSVSFIPAATNDAGPYGEWWYSGSGALIVPGGWDPLRDTEGFDYGLVLLDPGGNAPARPIGDVVGGLAYSYGGSPEGRSWRELGYPRTPGDRLRMVYQDGAYTRTIGQGHVVGRQGSLDKGTSGGPWIVDRNGELSAYGLHSFRSRTRFPGEEFSPFFDDAFRDFIHRHVTHESPRAQPIRTVRAD